MLINSARVGRRFGVHGKAAIPESMRFTADSKTTKTKAGVTVYSQKMFEGIST